MLERLREIDLQENLSKRQSLCKICFNSLFPFGQMKNDIVSVLIREHAPERSEEIVQNSRTSSLEFECYSVLIIESTDNSAFRQIALNLITIILGSYQTREGEWLAVRC